MRSVLQPPPGAGTDHNQDMARFCTWLKFFIVCGKPRCRREHACCGDPHACFRRHWAIVPDEFKARLRLVLKFHQNGMSPREAACAAEAEYARQTAAAAQPKPKSLPPLSPAVIPGRRQSGEPGIHSHRRSDVAQPRIRRIL
jgi:hypothetical protein